MAVGFLLGWLGVVILACMTNQNAAPKVSEPQISELTVRELAVREAEAKVRLADLVQAGQQQSRRRGGSRTVSSAARSRIELVARPPLMLVQQHGAQLGERSSESVDPA